MDFFPIVINSLKIYFFLSFGCTINQWASLNAQTCMVLHLPYLQYHESNQIKKKNTRHFSLSKKMCFRKIIRESV